MSTENVISTEELAKHTTEADCWLAIDGKVYNVTPFLESHPAGARIILDLGGKDATKEFWAFHRAEVLVKYAPKLLVGQLAQPKAKIPRKASPLTKDGLSLVPMAEPPAWQGFSSPYYKPSHYKWRAAVRAWVDKHIVPNVDNWERAGKEPSRSVFKAMGEAGILAANLGPCDALRSCGIPLLGGVVAHEDFDYFHEQILHEEFYRIGAPGLSDGLGCGLIIGLPPVFKFGSPALAQRVVPQCLSGDKKICLAISEPGAGSDVAGAVCRAVKSACGQFYVVSGVKKWITNGLDADYFATAVRTGSSGPGGMSLLLVERGPGVTTAKIATGYSGCAGTSLVMFDNVKVPLGNLLGKEGEGFKCVMHNFNHERWFISNISVACARRTLEECFKWAMQRQAFGRPLVEQAVIRGKLATMASELEASQAYLDSVTFQMCTLPYEKQNLLLAAPIALLKVQTAKMNENVTNEGAQIFGGRGLSQTGMGKIVWRFRSANQFNGVLGGTNEVLADLAIRTAVRTFPEQAKL